MTTTIYIILGVVLLLLIVLVVLLTAPEEEGQGRGGRRIGRTGGRDEISLLIRAAEAKLAAAKLESGARVGNLPALPAGGRTVAPRPA